MKADDAPAHATSQIYSGDEKKIYSAVFYTKKGAKKRARFVPISSMFANKYKR